MSKCSDVFAIIQWRNYRTNRSGMCGEGEAELAVKEAEGKRILSKCEGFVIARCHVAAEAAFIRGICTENRRAYDGRKQSALLL